MRNTSVQVNNAAHPVVIGRARPSIRLESLEQERNWTAHTNSNVPISKDN